MSEIDLLASAPHLLFALSCWVLLSAIACRTEGRHPAAASARANDGSTIAPTSAATRRPR